MRSILLGILLMLSIPPASAAYLTGIQILSECDQESDACIGYVMGAVDNVALLQELGVISYNICVPNAITPVELVQILNRGLKERPGELEQPASFLLVQILGGSFPCKGSDTAN